MANSNDDIIEKLATLARLHTDGALSDEEFKTLKERLISQASKAGEDEDQITESSTDTPVESEISKLVQETYGNDTQSKSTTEETAFASDPGDARGTTTHADNSPGHETNGEPWGRPAHPTTASSRWTWRAFPLSANAVRGQRLLLLENTHRQHPLNHQPISLFLCSASLLHVRGL